MEGSMQQAATSARVVSVSKEQDGVAMIHFNRPPANSYDRRFIDELNAAIDEIRFDESVAAAVLASDLPKFFSAGADINMFRTVSSRMRAMTILHMHEVLRKIEHTPKVFIAAIGWRSARSSWQPKRASRCRSRARSGSSAGASSGSSRRRTRRRA